MSERLLLATERGLWGPCCGILSNAEWSERFGDRTSRKVALPRITASRANRGGAASHGSTEGHCWVQVRRLEPFDLTLRDQPVPDWIYG